MEHLFKILTGGEQPVSEREEELSTALTQLFAEFDTGAISPETAQEIRYQALRGLGVCGRGWEAAEEALRIAFATPD